VKTNATQHFFSLYFEFKLVPIVVGTFCHLLIFFLTFVVTFWKYEINYLESFGLISSFKVNLLISQRRKSKNIESKCDTCYPSYSSWITFPQRFLCCDPTKNVIFPIYQGHQNDTIVVNQPRLDTDEEDENRVMTDGDYQLTIVDENNKPIRHIVRVMIHLIFSIRVEQV